MMVQNQSFAGITELTRIQLLDNERRQANLSPSYSWAAIPKGNGYEVSVTMTAPQQPDLVFTWQADMTNNTCVPSNAEAAKLEHMKFRVEHDTISNPWLGSGATPEPAKTP